MKLTTDLRPVSRARMSGVLPPLPPHAFMARTRATLPSTYLTLYSYNDAVDIPGYIASSDRMVSGYRIGKSVKGNDLRNYFGSCLEWRSKTAKHNGVLSLF